MEALAVEDEIRKFVCGQLRDCTDLSELTINVVKGRYLKHVGQASLSSAEKLLMKKVVREELIKMQDSDQEDGDYVGDAPPMPPHRNKRKREDRCVEDTDVNEEMAGDGSKAKRSRIQRSSQDSMDSGIVRTKEGHFEEMEVSDEREVPQNISKKNGTRKDQKEAESSESEVDMKRTVKGESREDNGDAGCVSDESSGEEEDIKDKVLKKTVKKEKESDEEDSAEDEPKKKSKPQKAPQKRKMVKNKKESEQDSDSSSQPSSEDEPKKKSKPQKALKKRQAVKKEKVLRKTSHDSDQDSDSPSPRKSKTVKKDSEQDSDSSLEDEPKKKSKPQKAPKKRQPVKKEKVLRKTSHDSDQDSDSSSPRKSKTVKKDSEQDSDSSLEDEPKRKSKPQPAPKKSLTVKKEKEESDEDSDSSSPKKSQTVKESDEDSDSSSPKENQMVKESDEDSESQMVKKEKESDHDSDSSPLPSLEDEPEEKPKPQKAPQKRKPVKKEKVQKKTSHDDSDQDSDSPSTKKGKRVKNQSEGEQKVDRLKHYIRLCGVRLNYKKLFDGCNTTKGRVDLLKRELEELGMEGQPSIKKCTKIRLKRERAKEVAELDLSNIITTHGRPKRSTPWQSQPSSAPFKRAVNSSSDSDDSPHADRGRKRAIDWSNLQGIISDDGDSE